MSFFDFAERKTEVARALKQFCVQTILQDNVFKGNIHNLLIVPLNKYEHNWFIGNDEGKFILSYLNLSELYHYWTGLENFHIEERDKNLQYYIRSVFYHECIDHQEQNKTKRKQEYFRIRSKVFDYVERNIRK